MLRSLTKFPTKSMIYREGNYTSLAEATKITTTADRRRAETGGLSLRGGRSNGSLPMVRHPYSLAPCSYHNITTLIVLLSRRPVPYQCRCCDVVAAAHANIKLSNNHVRMVTCRQRSWSSCSLRSKSYHIRHIVQ